VTVGRHESPGTAPTVLAGLADLGTATIHEAGARVVDLALYQLVAGSSVAGPARIAVCAHGDNWAVHEVISHISAGDVVVLSMPEPNAFGMVGELLARQAQLRGAAAIIIDGGVRDTTQLRALGLPIWAKHIRVQGTAKVAPGGPAASVCLGGVAITSGDVVVADADGVVVVAPELVDQVLRAGIERQAAEDALRHRIEQGETTFDMFGLST
jgi:4-hydroxy-4-methyl-2-oxoglutarate aldolase